MSTIFVIVALLLLIVGIVLLVLPSQDIITGETNQSLARFGGTLAIIFAIVSAGIAYFHSGKKRNV